MGFRVRVRVRDVWVIGGEESTYSVTNTYPFYWLDFPILREDQFCMTVLFTETTQEYKMLEANLLMTEARGTGY